MKFINKLRLFGLLMLTVLSFSSTAQMIQLGTGSGTSSYIPNYYLYNYSYSQTIYTAAELVAGGAAGIPGTITKIRYKPTSSVATLKWKTWTVYMGNTTQAGFTSSSNWTPVSAMTNVFSGDLPIATTVANTWIEITLSTPFAWDGTSNIVIAVDENAPSYGNNPNWAGYTLAPATGNKGIYFYSDGTNPDPNSPPTTGSYLGATNAVAQIQFEGTFAPPCTGTPSAGTVPATAAVCGGNPYTLVATGVTTGASGLTGQWQYRTPAGTGPWSDLVGATTASYTVAIMPVTPTDYRYTLTCGTNTGTSNTMTTTINPANQCYCVPAGTNASYFIDSFTTTGGIVNIVNGASGYSAGGYGNFTSKTVSQYNGSVVNFFGKYSTATTYGTKIWVDWNQDGVFDNTTEVVYSSSTYAGSQAGSFTVPLTALPGTTRMRVGLASTPSSGPATPCMTNLSGEYEDYTFVVTAPTGCLLPNNIVASNLTNDAATISWTPNPLGDAYATFNYEVRTTGTPGSGSTGLSASGTSVVDTFANLTGLMAGTTYSVYVRTNCTGATQSAWTPGTSFTLPTYVPVAISGFSDDVIANGVGSALSSTTNDVDGVSYALVGQDYKASPTGASPTKFLPNGGKIASGTKWYQLANYSGNNDLRLQGASKTGTINFLTPKQATSVYVLGISGSAASTISAQVWFHDNTSQTFAGLSYPDWFSTTGNTVVTQVGRINRSNNGLEAGAGPQLFENTLAISAANQSKQIDSIVFSTGAASTGVMNVLAISIVPNYTQACGLPSSLSANNVTATSANIAWVGNGTSTSYQVSYGAQGTLAANGTISTITGTSTNLTTLTSNTAYQVFVRSVCAGSTYSDWVGPVNFQTPLVACTGTPSAGTVPATMAVCAGQPINLVATGVTNGVTGLTGQWQYRTPAGTGAWVALAGATTETYTVSSSPATATDYRYTLTCGTNTGNSNTLTTTINPATQCYCIPASSNASYYIDSFATAGGSTNIINGATGYSTGGYGNFTSKTVSQDLGSSINFLGQYGGGTFGTSIWVDWNQNGVLDNAGELVYSSSTYSSSQSGTFTVPATALPGTTRMRVGISYLTGTGPASPCSISNDGEYEDYTFVVTVPTCAVPSALTSSNVTDTAATISWTAASPAPANGYEYYLSTTNTAPTATTVATGSVAAGIVTKNLIGLTQSTSYFVWVRSVCSPTNKSNWTLATNFVTLTPGQIGTGTGTNQYLPIFSCYGYNYSQQIYLASELSSTIPVGNNYITKIRFNQTTTASTPANYNDWTVYMGNTTKTAFANSTDWVAAASMNQVFSGVLSTVSGAGWVEITLATPFTWDGTSNIVIGVDENSPGYSCTANWASFTASTNRGILYYNDGTNPDPLLPPAANYGPTATIPQVQFVGIAPPPPNCVTTPISPANNGGICYSATPATLTWPAVTGATSYDLYLNSGATATTLIGNFTTTSYTTATALATGAYSWKIVPINAIGSATGCSTFSFTVYSLPTAPIATNSTQCGSQVPLASVSSSAGVNGSGTFNWYDAATAGNLLQGEAFSSSATTWYADDYSGTVPTPVATLGGSAAISGGSLVLQPTVVSQGGNIVIDASGTNATMFNTDFDVTLTATSGSIADGFSYSFGDDVVGLTNASTPTAEKGSGSKLRLMFMTYNASGINAKGVYLVYNTNATDFTATANGVLAYSTNASWIPTAAGFVTTHISLSINAEGKATVMLGTTPLFTNIQLPTPYLAENKATWKHAISSRSGGIAGGFSIDNVVLQKNAAMPGYTTYQQPVAATTTFYVSETSPGGCESPRTPVTVTVSPAPVVNLGNDTAICAGQSLTLSAGAANSGNTKLWSNNATTQTITVTTAGTYTVTVNNGGCSTSDTIVVGVNAIPIVNLGNDTSICAGQSLTLNAGAANSAYTKLWSNAATTQTIAVTTAGTYSVKVSNGTCSKSDTIVVGVTPSPVVNLGNDTTICAGQTLTLNAGAANTAYTKLWSNAATTQTIAVTTAGTYSVKVTNGACSTRDTIVVGVNAIPVVNIGNDTAICSGSVLTLNAGASNSTYTKLWSNAATTQTIAVSTAGTYSVKVSNGACSKSDTIVVIVNAIPVVNLGNDTTICAGQTLTLNAGTANSAYSKLWSNAATTQTIAVTTAGTYSVKVSNGTCSKSDTIVVGVNAIPVVNLGNDTAICAGQSLTLSAGAANSAYTKLWSNSATTQTITVTTAGTYSVKVNNGACSAKDTIVVGVTPIPVIDLGMDTAICSGQPLTLDAGNAGATYLWSDNSTSQTLDVTAAGTYSVIVSNGNCSATDSIDVNTIALPVGDSITFTLTDCSFEFSVANEQNADTYSWNYGDGSAIGTGANPSHTYASSGSYDVMLTMNNICGDSLVLTKTVSCIAVGIKNIDLSKDALKLYPNPTSNKITIENSSNLNMEYITVFNVLGQIVYQAVPQSAVKHQMNVSNLASGLYTVRIKTNEGMVVRKFEILK